MDRNLKERIANNTEQIKLTIVSVNTDYIIKNDVCELCGHILDTENRFYCFRCSLDFCGGC